MYPSFHDDMDKQIDVNPAHIEVVKHYKGDHVALCMTSGNSILVRADEWAAFTEAQSKRAEYLASLEYRELAIRDKMLKQAELQASGLLR